MAVAVGSAREPEEWKKGTAEARAARTIVASQLAEQIVTSDITGSRQHVADRVRQFTDAERTGDKTLQRAAAMEAAAAFAALAVRYDLRQ